MRDQINFLLNKLDGIDTAAKLLMRKQLEDHINELLCNDFSRLIDLLYHADIDEKKLKGLLSANPDTDAAILIADLLIIRHEEKLSSRKSYGQKGDIPEDEKW